MNSEISEFLKLKLKKNWNKIIQRVFINRIKLIFIKEILMKKIRFCIKNIYYCFTVLYSLFYFFNQEKTKNLNSSKRDKEIFSLFVLVFHGMTF